MPELLGLIPLVDIQTPMAEMVHGAWCVATKDWGAWHQFWSFNGSESRWVSPYDVDTGTFTHEQVVLTIPF